MENCFYWREPSQSARAGLHDLLRSSLRRIGLREVTELLTLTQITRRPPARSAFLSTCHDAA